MRIRKYIKTISFCVMFFVALTMSAQLTVDNFALRENDMSGMATGVIVRDPNGDRCALIKVFAPQSEGFSFYGGATSGFLTTEVHGNEIWVFAPSSAQTLTISHATFGRIEYEYPVALRKGATYELLLNVGSGRFVNINSTGMTNARITINGKYVGDTPIYNHFLPFGRYTIAAEKNFYEGETAISVSSSDNKDVRQVLIDMTDMSSHYGDVLVTVANKADIWFNGQNVGNGEWKTQLREGNYTIETRKADSDPAVTSFTVVARQENKVKANPPTQHTGWLRIYTRPRNVKTLPYDLSETLTLPVGTYQVEFSKKGYITQNLEYTVRRNETTRDTITLQRVTYVKPLAFYFGGAVTLRSLTGISGIVGAVYQRHDIQASYTFGLSESDAVYWGGDVNTATKYKMNSIGLKYGYQFNPLRQLAITPQIGFAYNFLTANAAVAGSTTYGNGASSSALAVGAKIVLVPMQHLYFFVAPEYMFALSQDKNFKTITKSSNFSGDGFAVHLGILANF